MKKSFLAFMLCFGAPFFAQADLQNPVEFEYIHCVAVQVPARQLTTHYVIDVRNPQRYQLSTARALQNAKASDLQRLRQIDPMLTQTQGNGYDIVWRSNPARLQFNLNIADDGGQTLIGNITAGRKVTAIKCLDVSLEK